MCAIDRPLVFQRLSNVSISALFSYLLSLSFGTTNRATHSHIDARPMPRGSMTISVPGNLIRTFMEIRGPDQISVGFLKPH